MLCFHMFFLACMHSIKLLSRCFANSCIFTPKIRDTMELIENNPYRIAGILSNATERELQKQKAKITAYSRVGREIKSDFDFEILNSITRTENLIYKAFSTIEQNQDKVNFALFWFLNANPFDNTAIEYLKNGNAEKAVEIWEKVTTDKNVNSKNFSAFNNLGTYKLLSKNKSDIKTGIDAKMKLIESNYFENFVHSVADETFTIDNKKQMEKLVDELLMQFKNQYSSSESLELFSNCNGSTQKYLSEKFTEEPIYKIESQIESCKKKRKSDKGNAYAFGQKLYANTKKDLSDLKSLLGSSDLKYKAIADQLANEIMQCGIDYFNESLENDSSDNYLESSQKLTKLANSIAVGELAKDRAKDSLATLADMKDRDLDQTIAFLQSVKDLYEKNEKDIRKQIEELKVSDYELRIGLKTINYTAVNENIENSIKWGLVNDRINELLSDKTLTKIKESTKTDAKNEFLELASWLKAKSPNSTTISNIIRKYKSLPPKLYFEVLSADITNTDSKSNSINKAFYVEDIRHVGLNLKVKSTGHQKVTIYKKYINPEQKCKRSKDSPRGYTSSIDVTIRSNTKEIDLNAWGNNSECTYQVGEHKIEIYVENYKIFTKSFKVDWSPTKKAQLTRALQLLKRELSEVEEFTWFRLSYTKKEEVRAVKIKISRAMNILMNKK